MSAYDARFFDYVDMTASRSAQCVLPLLQSQLQPASVLDVGCGRGAWLEVWQTLGVRDVAGVDGDYVARAQLLIPPAMFLPADLRQGFDLGRRFDLVQCLEVAEHIPAAFTPRLLDSLTRHSPVIFFSAAPPGQGGHDHVNERSYEYWRREFAARSYRALDFVRPRIRGDARVAPWYRYNALLFVHADRLPTMSLELQSARIPDSQSVPDLAPLAYRLRREMVRRLPVAAMTLIAKVKERLIGHPAAGPPPGDGP